MVRLQTLTAFNFRNIVFTTCLIIRFIFACVHFGNIILVSVSFLEVFCIDVLIAFTRWLLTWLRGSVGKTLLVWCICENIAFKWFFYIWCLLRAKRLDEIFCFKTKFFSLPGLATTNVWNYQQSIDPKPCSVRWLILSLICNLLSMFSLGRGCCSFSCCFCVFRFADSSAPFSFFFDIKVGRLNVPYVQFTCKIAIGQ